MIDIAEISHQISVGNRIMSATITPVTVGGNLNFISIVLEDISDFVHLERALLKRNKELGIINTLSGAFISSGEIDSVFMNLLEKVLIVTDFTIGWIVMKEKDAFAVKNISGASLALKQEIESGEFDSIYKNVAVSDDPLYILESEDTVKIAVFKNEGIMFFACVPLRVGAEIMGFLALASRQEMKLDFDTAALLSLIGNNISLIAEKIRLFQGTQLLSITDDLTGLYNIRYFYDALSKEIARAKRYMRSFSLIIFDIDNFKILNDTFGHQAGDEVLRLLAAILKDAARQTDIIARYGGEEFIIILPNTPKHEAVILGNRIREKVEEYNYYVEGNMVRITISGGIATFPEDAEDSKSLLYASDMALYNAKALGKKQVQPYRRNRETSL